MKNKRAQSEVITTVLIILLVLAAVFIVYTAVRNMVTTSTGSAEQKAKCLEVSLNIVSVNKTSPGTIVVTRGSGGTDTDVTGITVLVDGAAKTATETSATPDPALIQMQTKSYTIDGGLADAKKVEIGAIITGSYKCDIIDSELKANFIGT